MLIKIETAPRGPLSVIPEIPDARLAMIEGLNGIGKTLSVRLLQVCTGTLPYHVDSDAWRSLRDGLGEFVVTIKGLHGADEVLWQGDSSEWVPGQAAPSSSWFQSIAIDGKPAALEDIRRLLVVHRMAGDEGITETFASIAEADAEKIHRWRERFAAAADSPLAVLEEYVASALDLIGNLSEERYRGYVDRLERSRSAASSAEHDLKKASQRHKLVKDAADLRRRLVDLDEVAPSITAKLADVDAKIVASREERGTLEKELAALLNTIARAQPQQVELNNARRTLERNRKSLDREVGRAGVAASALGIDPDGAVVEVAVRERRQQLERLRTEASTLTSVPAMRDLLVELESDLVAAERSGLAEEIAIDSAEINVQLTVSQARAGVEKRHAYLDEHGTPPHVRALTAEIAGIEQELRSLRTLGFALNEVQRFRRLVDANEERVQKALQAGSGPAASAMHDVERRRRENDEALTELAGQRAALAERLRSLGGGGSRETLLRKLGGLLGELQLSEDDIDGEYQSIGNELGRAQARHLREQEELADAQRDLAQVRTEVRRISRRLLGSDDLEWLRRPKWSERKPSGVDPLTFDISTVEGARRIVESLSERFGKHRTQLAAIGRALSVVGQRLRRRTEEPQAVEYVEEAQRWLSRRFGAWFSDPRVRTELLPGAEGGVDVDVASRQVHWREGSIERYRPLDAFSSGEQAFAYTRARLALLDEAHSQVPNRLVVFDEFGAFIAHDRLQGLLGYLTEWTKKRKNAQIVVMLPLSRDYADLATRSIGGEALHYRMLAEQVAARRYSIRILVE